VLHLGRVLYDRSPVVIHGPSLLKLAVEPAVYLHPADAADRGVAGGDRAVLRGGSGEAILPVVLDESLMPGTVYLPFGAGVSVGSGLDVTVEAAS
jgi:anaerobic dimethyl sulfoxide reductase subunit A